jgi:hypothetical protein
MLASSVCCYNEAWMWKRFLFWDFPRGSRPYDLMVGVILVFVFLTPRAWFRDQPKIPQASQIAALRSDDGGNVFVVDTELLSGITEEQRVSKVGQIVKNLPGRRNVEITRVEAIYDSEGEIKAFMAFARP